MELDQTMVASEESVQGSHRCSRCGLLLLQPALGCPACAQAAQKSQPGSPAGQDEMERSRPTEWVPIHRCEDELTALTLQAELRGHGILSWIRSLAVSGYQTLVGITPAFWGWLLVDRGDAFRATEIVRQFLASLDREAASGDEG